MKTTSYTRSLARAAMTLFAVLFCLTGAWAQKALPYEYGFENNDLAAEGWTIVDGSGSSTGIKPAAKLNGSYGFQFFYNTNPPQYLISPELTGTENGVKVSFSYINPSTYDETFKVGYSTSTNDKDAFEWGEEITAATEWTEYAYDFPAGTKYVAVAYTANDQFKMYLDDFSFTVSGAVDVAKPTGLKVNYEGGTEATVSWVSDASAFDIEVNEEVTENVENPYTMTGLSLGTTYTIRVRAKEGTDVSVWTQPISFTTDFPVQSLPYVDSFEDGIGPWTLVDCNTGSGIVTTAHTGNKCFAFKYNTTPPQYLISPEFEGTSAMTVSFWYRVQGNSYIETFQVGYSTTTKDVSEFTWGDEVETNSTSWLEYEVNFPASTKYVAVRYNSNDKYYLFVDDFSFTVDNGVAKPTDLTVSEVGAKTALLSWAENGEATAWEICLNGNEENLIAADSNPFTLTGLTPETDYTVKVRAVSGDLKSNWSNEVAFTTDVEFPAPKDLAVVPASKGATVSWAGAADSYNLRYRSSPEGEVLFSDDFESGMDKWTIYTEGAAPQNDGWTAYQTTPSVGLEFAAHSGEYVASAWSWASNAYNANNWLVTPQVALGGVLKFWVRTNATYPDKYEVLLSTTGNAVADFTVTLRAMAKAPAVSAWNEVVIDLGAYAGQEGYIAIHHQDMDANYLLIDDFSVTSAPEISEWTTVENATSPYAITGLTPETNYNVQVQAVYADGKSEWVATSFTTLEDVPTPSALAVSDVTWGTAVLNWTENGEATAWEICLNGDEENLVAADSNPFTVEGLTPETEYTAKVRATDGKLKSKWSNEVTFTTEIRFHAPTELAAGNITATSAEISWTADAAATGAVLEYATTEGANLTFTEYKYDNGELATSVGLGGDPFQWGVMFPAGSYSGSYLSKVSVFDPKAMTGTVTIYNDGVTAPENAISTVPVTFTGAGEFIDITIDASIDASKNVWVIFYNESGTDYPAACSNDDLGDANGRWVEINGTWYDLAYAGISGRCFMIRAEIGEADFNSLTWTTVADATSPYELTDLTPETTYAVRVKSVFEEGESKWTSTFFTTATDNPVPANIVADLTADGATLTWEGNGDSYNVQYRTAESSTTIFEDMLMDNLDQWTVITAGEGPGWAITEYGATAYSFENNIGAYNADNWLISPEIELGNLLQFYATTATSYPDSYEVLLSTTGTETTDFTVTLQEMAEATPGYVTIDLSEYAGQKGYIAIHHVSNDCYLLAINYFGIYDYVPAGQGHAINVTEPTATISGLETNKGYEYQIQSLKGDKASDWSEMGEFALLTLNDNAANNTKLLYNNNARQAHVTLAGRTLFKDGNWNTLTLPFDVDDIEDSPLAGAEAKTLENADINENEQKVTLNFGNAVDNLVAGTPYIIKWNQDDNIENPEFANVIIKNTLTPVSLLSNQVKFIGYYDAKNITSADTDIFYMGADNKLKTTGVNRTLKACRAYFQFAGAASSAREFTLNFGDGEATGISQVESEVNGNDAIYDLQGRRVVNINNKGLFIQNGKKVVIK